ncbi:hypothetical protein PENSPDRAFT_691532 [Peniophora sp. CONT]|nr:hypothetical protein PENSPDRAFT_691532 [Peniophora sp. CONT]
MSRKATITLATTVAVTIGIVFGVHWQQQREHEVMYQGVLRDDERRREKMKQREEDFRLSQEKRRIYEAVQTVKPSAEHHSEPDTKSSWRLW